MKTLCPGELAQLLPADPATLARAFAHFELLAPILCREPGYLHQLKEGGWMEVAQVVNRETGRASHLIGWHLSLDCGFWWDVVVRLEAPMPYEAVIDAVENLARDKGAKYIRWVTMRRGIVTWAQGRGYTPECVILTKPLVPRSGDK